MIRNMMTREEREKKIIIIYRSQQGYPMIFKSIPSNNKKMFIVESKLYPFIACGHNMGVSVSLDRGFFFALWIDDKFLNTLHEF